MDAAAFSLIILALKSLPSLIDSGKDLIASIQGLTPDQSAQLQAAQQDAHESLQAAVAAAAAEERTKAAGKGDIATGE